jgi:pentatricopeptide repeat protein
MRLFIAMAGKTGSGSGSGNLSTSNKIIETSLDREFLDTLLSGCTPAERDTDTYTSMITVCERCGARWEIALALLNHLCDEYDKRRQAEMNNYDPSSFPSVAPKEFKKGEQISARHSYNGDGTSSRRGSRNSKKWSASLKPDTKLYSAAITCCGKAREWQHAVTLFNRMDEEGNCYYYLTIIHQTVLV